LNITFAADHFTEFLWHPMAFRFWHPAMRMGQLLYLALYLLIGEIHTLLQDSQAGPGHQTAPAGAAISLGRGFFRPGLCGCHHDYGPSQKLHA